jgi:DNA topoisomerase VI subunit B
LYVKKKKKKRKKEKKLTSIMFYMVAWDYKTAKMLLQVHDAIKQHFKIVAKERVEKEWYRLQTNETF